MGFAVLRVLSATAALGLASCGQAASRDAPPRAAARRFAVAGISPGMTPSAVAGLMMSSGYVEEQYKRAGCTFAEEVAKARGGDAFTRSGLGDVSYRQGGETVMVTYIAMPSGPIVSSVVYGVGPGTMTLAEMQAEMVRRYGHAPIVVGRSMTWCRSGAHDCDRRELYMLVSAVADQPSVVVADPAIRERQSQAIRGAPGGQRTTM